MRGIANPNAKAAPRRPSEPSERCHRDGSCYLGAAWASPRRHTLGRARIAVPGRRVGGPSRLGGLRRRLTVLGRRPGREKMSSGCVAASQKPAEDYRASSLHRGYRSPRWPPPRLRLLSGREEPAARPRPRETPIADESGRPPREQKAEKPTPQRTGKPSRAGGATSPLRQWTSSRGSNLKGMGGGATARTAPRRERPPQMSAR